MSTGTATSAVEPTASTRSWIPIAATAGLPVLVVLTGGILGLAGSVLPGGVEFLIALPLLVAGACWLFSPIAVYYDRQHVETVSNWGPSRWYYLMFLGPIGVALAIVYTWRRHKYVGTP